MEKVDFEKSKQLSRILAGKENPLRRKTHAEKLCKVQTQMFVKDILKDVTEAREILRNIESDPGLETERYLFSFKNKFHFIESGNYRKIEDAEAKQQLDEHDDMKIYYLCTGESICPLPPALIGRKGTKGVQLEDDQAVIDYIKQVSGVEIKITDL